MWVNGVPVERGDDCLLMNFIEREGYDIGRIAVEKNGKIVPKSSYETELLGDDDRLEIVTFVGGG